MWMKSAQYIWILKLNNRSELSYIHMNTLTHCSVHTAVYLNFGGENLPTHSYVAISELGTTEDTALVCRTDQANCCNGDIIEGGWFNPDGTMVEFNANSSQGFYSSVDSKGVHLLRGSGIPVEGIYTCRATDSSSTTNSVFIGLYNEDGGKSECISYSCVCICVVLKLHCRESDG